MSVSMEDIAAVYEERDGIKYTGTAGVRKERLALLENDIANELERDQAEDDKELYGLAKYSPFVAAHLEYFESGLLGKEEMLLRLSICLAKQNKGLLNDLVKMKLNQPAQPSILPDGRLYLPLKEEKGEIK